MTDINFSRPAADPDSTGAETGSPAARSGEFRWDIIELLFFAYRDFVGDADHELEAFGFGRAHHRVMHFVYRYPGLNFRMSQMPNHLRRHPVRLGEDNDYVYREVLGLSDEEYAELERLGHIGMDYDPQIR